MTLPPYPKGRFDAIVIDPPWHFEVRSSKGERKSPQAHYRTMQPVEITALPIDKLLAPRGVVFLWCTWPLLARGVPTDVIKAWGLKGASGGSWFKRTAGGKHHFGTGFIWRGSCEPILVASREPVRFRGTKLRNVIETFEDFVFDGPAREHSRKPDEFYALVEALTFGARRLDMFAREVRPGFEPWGDEIGKFKFTRKGRRW